MTTPLDLLPGITRPDVAPVSRRPHPMAIVVAVMAAYALSGLLALQIAIPPGYASPLYPPAGIALASVLAYGWRALPGVALGSLAINLLTTAWRGPLDAHTLVVPAVAAAGAALQAAVAAGLVRRHVAQPLTLTEPRDIAKFFGFGGAIACLLNATLSSTAMRISGAIAPAEWPLTWLTWWTGDTLGVLIAAPVVFTLIGQPRAEWAPRRIPLGLTMVLSTLLVSAGIAQIVRWDRDRLQASFDRDALAVATALSAQLQEPLHALEALHGVFIASDHVGADEFRRASAAWLANGRLRATGWSQRLRRDEVEAFEAQAHAEGASGYRVFDRTDAGIAQVDPAADLVAVRYIEPAAANATALGVNSMSVAAARDAIEAAAQRAAPVASGGFRLSQQAPGEDRAGVVIYQPLYRGAPSTPAQRRAQLHGVVFVTLEIDKVIQGLEGSMPDHLDLCVVDREPRATRIRLAGPPGCETAPAELRSVRPLDFAQRHWELRISARADSVPGGTGLNAWLFSMIGLMAATMLGALLLTVTGRTRRIEAAVRERTAELEAEVRERQRAEARVSESEQRFRNILNNVPIGVIYTDLDGRVKQANPRLCELLGHDEAALQGRRWADHIHPDDAGEDAALTAQLVQGTIPMYRRHLRIVRHDGRMVWAQATVSLLRDAQGLPRSIVGVVEDITEHLRLQDAETARDRAEAANRAKSEFLSRMSHELRTPLNAMLGFAQLLELDQRHPIAPEHQPRVSQIQRAGWHLLEMINDVLDLSRIESDTLKLNLEPLDVTELLGATLPLVATEAERRGIRITTDLARGTGLLVGDATRTKQILTNLLTNAIKYNHDHGHVHVAARPIGTEVVEISVTDTGLGMTPEQLGNLFQPFNRLGRERSSHEGTGIGLVISQRLAGLMGGSLRARSTEGEGSSFVLLLPRSSAQDTVPSELDPLARREPAYHRRVVHYVEDNETNVEVMRGILAQRPQVRMDVSITGLDALAAIRRQPPDLILLDMHLPDISGLELLRHLKADPSTAPIPVVAVSADATEQQIEAALMSGAGGYLTKPVSVAELLTVVDEWLEQSVTRV